MKLAQDTLDSSEHSRQVINQDLSFCITHKILLDSLSNIYSIVDKKPIIPVLSNIMIVAKQDYIILSAVNVDLSIVQQIDNVKVLQEGSITVNAALFTDIVSKLSENITISEKDATLYLSSGRSKFSLATLPAHLFPNIDDMEYQNNFMIDAKKLHYLLQNASFAVSTDKSKQYLNGIFLHCDVDNKLCSVATDGHRLICVKSYDDFLENIMREMNIIIPRKTVIEIIKIIKNHDGKINFIFDQHGIKLIIDKIIIFSKLIYGTFPDYQKIVLQNPKFSFSVNRSVLRNSVNRIALVAPEKTKTIILHLKDNLLTISANSNELGSAYEEIEIEFMNGEQKIGFNALYITDILSILSSENIVIAFNNNLGPILFIDNDNINNIYILMPVRV